MLQLWGNKLKSLNLSDTEVSVAMTTSICPVLENLNVVQCRNCGDLNVVQCCNIGDAGLDNRLQLWGSKLRSVEHNYKISDAGLQRLSGLGITLKGNHLLPWPFM